MHRIQLGKTNLRVCGLAMGLAMGLAIKPLMHFWSPLHCLFSCNPAAPVLTERNFIEIPLFRERTQHGTDD